MSLTNKEFQELLDLNSLGRDERSADEERRLAVLWGKYNKKKMMKMS